jgi:septum site-determining protein MinC
MTASAFQLRGSLFTLTVLQLQNTDPQKFDTQLSQLTTQAPKFFQHAPVVIDLQPLSKSSETINFVEICADLRRHGLIPVGVRGATPAQQESALAAGLAIMSGSKGDEPELVINQPSTQTAEAVKVAATESTTRHTSKIITSLVRSGQQIYARNADLIVLASVSEGAELLSDGNIHVYGTLRGRALAGVTGDTTARIFCLDMQAELISIASRYVVSDSLQKHANQGPMQIYLDDGKLTVTHLV